MKIPCCKEHKNLKLKYESLKKSQDLLYEQLEKINNNKKIYKEALENAIFWLSKIHTENDLELAPIAIKAINQILNNIEAE